MFEDLCKQSITIERYLTAPLPEERLRYLRHLRGFGARKGMLLKMADGQLRGLSP